ETELDAYVGFVGLTLDRGVSHRGQYFRAWRACGMGAKPLPAAMASRMGLKQLIQLVEQRVVLFRRADGDAQLVAKPLMGEISHINALLLERFEQLGGPRTRRNRRQEKIRVASRDVEAHVRQSLSHPTTFGDDPRPSRGSMVTGPQRRRRRRLRDRVGVVAVAGAVQGVNQPRVA